MSSHYSSSRSTRTVVSHGPGGTRTQTTTTRYGGDGGKTVTVSGDPDFGGSGGGRYGGGAPRGHSGGHPTPSHGGGGGQAAHTFNPRAQCRARPASTGERGWSGNQDFNAIQKEIVSKGQQWEDPEFPPDGASVFYSTHRDFQWKRPHEISDNPQLFVGGASRFDVKQGALGDCWLLAAAASLSMNEELFHKVVPEGQNIGANSTGVVMFRFWQFGDWIEVLVDTLLPTHNGQLVFMHSAESNEFWSALLEKAYAKLFGSYEALKGGSSSEASEDFTGGVTEFFDFRKDVPAKMFEILEKANDRNSLMGCSIEAKPGVTEAKLDNGLIMGHAYSLTGVKRFKHNGREVKLVRARNPWGNEAEWLGAWSDKSREMSSLDDRAKRDLGVTIEDDGEFWMEYGDFTRNFQRVEICNLGPDSLEENETLGGKTKKRWEASSQLSSWQRNATAGGCRNHIQSFHMNPQFRVSVCDPDDDDDEDMGTLIVGLMQKGMRKMRAKGQDLRTIGYVIYEWKEGFGDTLPREFFERNTSRAKSPSFINLREICGRHKLPPGEYVIVPSTFDPNEEAEFLMRIFSEKPIPASEMDEQTKMVEPVKDDTPQDPGQVAALKKAFVQVAGTDAEIDAYELQGILNHAFMKAPFYRVQSSGHVTASQGYHLYGMGYVVSLMRYVGLLTPAGQLVFKFDGFSVETCRSLVAMMDLDQSGKLGCDEFIALWTSLNLWKNRFSQYDADKSGTLACSELKACLKKLGFCLSSKTLRSTLTRFARKDGTIEFDDFVLLAARLKTLFETFQSMDRRGQGNIQFNLDEFITTSIYL